MKNTTEEEIFVPYNIEERKGKRLQQIYKMLQQKHIEGDLDLRDMDITNLGKLESISGFLDLERTKITSLRNLKEVGEYLDLENTLSLFWDDIPEYLHSKIVGKTK